MIVVVEGIDRVGKTTLVDMLVARGFINLKDEFISMQPNKSHDFRKFSSGKCDTMVSVCKALHKAGHNVVVDRLHITEMVYGYTERNGCDRDALLKLDYALEELGAVLVYVKPTLLSEACERAGENLSKHNNMFDKLVKKSSISHVVECSYDSLATAADFIASGLTFQHDIYLAGPFFNPEQIDRINRVKTALRAKGFTVYVPNENGVLSKDADDGWRKQVFQDNCNAIRSSQMVFAVTDGKDIGTIWEAGYAKGLGHPVAYFAETLGDNPFNVMLAESGVGVFTKLEDITKDELDQCMAGIPNRKYEGDIQ